MLSNALSERGNSLLHEGAHAAPPFGGLPAPLDNRLRLTRSTGVIGLAVRYACIIEN